jgi:tripartite-type tricarboxylate transporter receptor subunit TctC
MERIAAERGIEFLHVPFRGGADNAQSLLSGQTQAMVDSTSWGPLVDGGQFRLLCTWGEQRAKRYPDAPTLVESGINIVSTSPYGIAAPKGVDPGIVKVLHDGFKQALYDPVHTTALERFDMPLIYKSSEDYRASVAKIIEEEGAIIRRLNLRIN